MKGSCIYKRLKAQMVHFGKGFISYNPVAIDLLQAFDILSMFQLNIWWLYQKTTKLCFLDFLFPGKLLALVAEVAGTLPWLAEESHTGEKTRVYEIYY